MKKQLLTLITLGIAGLGVTSYQVTNAFFTDTVVSNTNVLSAATEFQTTVTPTGEQTEPGKIVVNEISSNGDSDDEWIELYNTGGEEVDISGWKIGDQIGMDTIPSAIPIQPGEYVVIVTTGTSVTGIPTSAKIITLPNGNIGSGLNNIGDNIYLLNSSDVEVDRMGYGNSNIFGGNLPSSPGINQTIRRVPNGVDTDAPGDWQNGISSIGVSND